jgi:hypothetical protein
MALALLDLRPGVDGVCIANKARENQEDGDY